MFEVGTCTTFFLCSLFIVCCRELCFFEVHFNDVTQTQSEKKMLNAFFCKSYLWILKKDEKNE